MNTEPVATGGAVTALASAVVAILIGFEVVNWTEAQIGLVLAGVTALIGVVTAFQRQKVVPVVNVDFEDGPSPTVYQSPGINPDDEKEAP